MSYELIDPTITAWAAKRQLHVHTIHHDDHVRSVNLVGSDGRKCQIWIDPPNQQGTVHVHVWDYCQRREDYKTVASDLDRCLEQAFQTGNRWIQ